MSQGRWISLPIWAARGSGSTSRHVVAANAGGRPPDFHTLREFLRDVFTWSLRHPEVTAQSRLLLDFLALPPAQRAEDARHDLVPAIAWNGDVVVLSLELPAVLDRAVQLRYVRQYLTALEQCEARREFFTDCQGDHAGNRYFEHGTFTTTETDTAEQPSRHPCWPSPTSPTKGPGHDHPRPTNSPPPITRSGATRSTSTAQPRAHRPNASSTATPRTGSRRQLNSPDERHLLPPSRSPRPSSSLTSGS